MTTHNDQDYLHHILESIEKIAHYISEFTYEEFVKDDRTSDAVVRQFMVLGEAASQISEEFKDKHATVPWHLATGMRNKLVHDYLDVDIEVVWNTATTDLPKLKEQISAII